MPVYLKGQYSKTTQIAIWKIEEPEVFFQQHTGLFSAKKHAKRRLEHLAGRFLLKYVHPEFPLHKIAISPLGKPYLPGNELFFSISHSFPYIAVTVDTGKETGIDIQVLHQKIIRLQSKFLSDQEQQICANDPGKITLAWAAKEAAFKQYGLGAVDFIRHMPITQMDLNKGEAKMMMTFKKEKTAPEIQIHGGLNNDFAWAVTT